MAYGQVTVNSNTAIQVVAANTQRLSLIITNNGTSSVLIGNNSLLTTATGSAVIVAGGTLTEDSGGTKMYCGPIFAIATDSKTILGYWERIINN